MKANLFTAQALALAIICTATGLFAPMAHAVGTGDKGGGDRCELRFKAIASDIKHWIANDGHARLKLGEVSPEGYATQMIAALSNFRVTCVGPGDEGYPVEVGGKAKECVNFYDANEKVNRIQCDLTKFYSGLKNPENDPVQYRITHHEFATLAGFEKPNSDDSNYALSSQITAFLEDQLIKKLAIKPSAKPVFSEETLQKRLRGVINAYNYTCNGDPCYSVWTEQIRAVDDLNRYVDRQLNNDLKLSDKTGKLARSAAVKICTAWATGDLTWVARLVASENAGLDRLEQVQEMAGVANPKKCRRKINP